MRSWFFVLAWFSVGMGVLIVYGERHNKPLPEEPAVFLLACAVWPAFVTAEVYRAVTNERGAA